MSKGSPLCKVMCLLVMIGAINWGLIGLGQLMGGADWNVVNMILGSMPMVENIVYLLVGVSGVMKVMCGMKGCSSCNTM